LYHPILPSCCHHLLAVLTTVVVVVVVERTMTVAGMWCSV